MRTHGLSRVWLKWGTGGPYCSAGAQFIIGIPSPELLSIGTLQGTPKSSRLSSACMCAARAYERTLSCGRYTHVTRILDLDRAGARGDAGTCGSVSRPAVVPLYA